MKIASPLTLVSAGAIALSGFAAAAQESIGKPVPGGTGFQPAVTELMRDIVWFDTFLHWLSFVIVLLVCGLLLAVIVKFPAHKNPTPSRRTHNALLEVVWTGVPVVVLIIVAVISLPLLFKQLNVPESDVVIKATGNQWYWSYEYPDEEIEFDAIMLAKDELADAGYSDDEFLLATDEAVVVPVNANVHLITTGADVIHAWTIPAFGVKIDSVPGRINEVWFNADTVGTYFGQCSELCGKDHSYMPIVVKVVSQDDYETWIDETQNAMNGDQPVKVAAAE